jgi:ribokinase
MRQNPLKAVTVGSSAVDIITVIADENVERITMANATASFLLLEQGRKIDAQNISIHCGGGAVNVGVSLRRLGFDVAVLSKVGIDLNAAQVHETLRDEGIDDGLLIETDEMATGVAVMISSHDRNATIFTHRGANTLLRCDELKDETFKDLDLLYVASLSGSSADCFPDLLKRGKAGGAMVAANPGIRQLTSRREEFFDAIGNLDLLNMNRVESEALLPGMAAAQPSNMPLDLDIDGPELVTRGLRFEGLHLELERFTAELHERGPRFVIVTDGVRGAYLSTGGAIHHCPVLTTDVAGTAGAGDAFASTTAAFLCSGANPDEALRAATANASSVVEHVDTQEGLQKRDALDRRIAEHASSLRITRLR